MLLILRKGRHSFVVNFLELEGSFEKRGFILFRAFHLGDAFPRGRHHSGEEAAVFADDVGQSPIVLLQCLFLLPCVR